MTPPEKKILTKLDSIQWTTIYKWTINYRDKFKVTAKERNEKLNGNQPSIYRSYDG